MSYVVVEALIVREDVVFEVIRLHGKRSLVHDFCDAEYDAIESGSCNEMKNV